MTYFDEAQKALEAAKAAKAPTKDPALVAAEAEAAKWRRIAKLRKAKAAPASEDEDEDEGEEK